MPRRYIHVAVAVIWRNGKILIARRPARAHQGNLLEFPGGKVEPGETVQQALVRELAEETGVIVKVTDLEPLIRIRHDYGDKQVFLDVWQTAVSSGDPVGLEGQPVYWLAPDALADESFPEANRPIIRALRLPRELAITGPFDRPADGLEQLRLSLERRRSNTGSEPSLILLRAPWLSVTDYRQWVMDAARLTEGAGTRLLVHNHPELVDGHRIVGTHLSQAAVTSLERRPVSVKDWFGVSCHNQQELARATALGADYATVSPVHPTRSHPGAATLGWGGFGELAARATLPVYALGGVGPGDQSEAVARGGQGVAGISHWWC